MSKEAYYFSHDANARHDPKILAMRSEWGIKGYGIYWIIIEMLREQENYQLPKKEYIYNAIAMQVQCKDFAKEDAKRFVDDCINVYELLHEDEHFIFANSLLKRMEKRNDISKKRSAAAKARWEKAKEDKAPADGEDAKAIQMDANAKQTDARKGKEKKGNIKDNIPYAEIIDYLNEKAERNFKPTAKKTQTFIKARFNEGYSLDDFKKVIDNKVIGWTGTKYENFLRPETLFGPKFEGYLNEKPNNQLAIGSNQESTGFLGLDLGEG